MPPRTRIIAFSLAWLVTAAVAFSLGRLASDSSSSEKATAARNAASSASSSTAGPDGGSSSLLPGVREASASASGGGWQSVTGGKPLKDWLKTLMAQEDEILRTQGFMRLLDSLKTPEEVQEALETVASQMDRGWRGFSRSREYTMLLQKWTELDAKGAAEYAAKNEDQGQRFIGSATVLRTWTRLDPNAALAYVQGNEAFTGGGPGRDGGGGGEEGNWGVAAVVSQLAKTDLERAMTLAAAEPVSRVRGRMMDSLIGELVAQRGESGVREALSALPAGQFRDGMIGQYAARLADKSGPEALSWAGSLPPGESRNRAYSEVFRQWADDDVVAAGTALSKMPPSVETDGARERYAQEVLRRDPVSAMEWAQTITSDEQRARAQETLIRSWMRRDRNAATNWLNASPLAPEFKQRVTGG